MRVLGGWKEFFAGSSPVAVLRHFRRIGPLSEKQNVPRQIAMRKCGGILGYPGGGAAVVFEDDNRDGRAHTVRVLDGCYDRVVCQLPLQRGLPIIVVAI